MRVERFKASDMKGAMKLVKERLGPDAVILHTRSIPNTSILPLGRKNDVEIIAAVDQPSANGKFWKPENIFKSHLQKGMTQVQENGLDQRPELTGISEKSEDKVEITEKQTLTTNNDNSYPYARNSEDWDSFIQYAAQNGQQKQENFRPVPSIRERQENANFTKMLNQEVTSFDAEKRLWLESEKRLSGLKREMNEIKEMLLRQELKDLKDKVKFQHEPKNAMVQKKTEDRFKLLYERMSDRLIERGVSESITKEIVSKVRSRIDNEKFVLHVKANVEKIREFLIEEIARRIPIVVKNMAPRSKPRVLAFIGPPGSGKTSVCAKIAVKNAYLYNKKVSIVLANMSPNSVNQHLSSIANIAQLPLSVVQSPDELKATIEGYKENDMILIDFAGDYNSAARKGTQLGRLLKAASPHETHLVLPSNLKTTDSIAIAKGYESMNFDHVVISKIDGTSSMGSLLEVLHKINKPISYFSTGPVIPDDIEPASPVKLANLILSR